MNKNPDNTFEPTREGERHGWGADRAAPSDQALPQARRDVEITEQVYHGRPCYILKDPVALRYYRLRPPEYTVYRLLDGRHKLEDIQRVLAERFPAEEFGSQDIMSFLIMLRSANLLQPQGPEGARYLLRRRQVRRVGPRLIARQEGKTK